MTRTLFLFFFALTLSAQADPHPSVRLTWQAATSGDAPTGYHIWRSSTSGGPYTAPIGTVPAGTLTYLDTTVIAGATYYYTVSAYDPAGDSTKTPEVSCVIPFQIPTAPSGLQAVTQ